jgi:ABC-type transport system involved in multi-copper enzyme maturation permease subunit
MNPIAVRLVGAASRRQRDFFIRTGFVTLLATVLLLGLLGVLSTGRLSLRDLAAGSAQIFAFLSVVELLLICLLTPIFMAGAVSKEAEPRTWDIMLTTPLSAFQIVVGYLFGRLFFIATLLLSALPFMIITQFFGGVQGETILLTQLIAFCLALLIGSIAVATSVTRTVGRKAVVTLFVFTVCYLASTWVVDHLLRVPITTGAQETFTTVLTSSNPLLVLEALLSPATYVIPESSSLTWPLNLAITHPVATWCTMTCVLSFCLLVWSALQVRTLGDRSKKKTIFTRSAQTPTNPKLVTGNPIAWRERVTRHRNISSLFGRWGFTAIGVLIVLVTTTLFATRTWDANFYRAVIITVVGAEIIIVILAAIYVSASSITKEREDGSLDLLLTTSLTPKTYLSGKLRGIVIHLLPMVLTPIITLYSMAFAALLGGAHAIVSDTPVGMQAGEVQIPLVLAFPAFAFPFVLIPFLTFCITLGLQWSLRSKGSIRAVASTLCMMLVISFGLGGCMTPAGSFGFGGALIAALSPVPYVVAISSSAKGLLPNLFQGGVLQANMVLFLSAVLAGTIWSLVSWGLLRSIANSFVITVRRLSGTS